ncbi:hypothetical protein QTP70_020948, partial [Hemibagrus guttatus]
DFLLVATFVFTPLKTFSTNKEKIHPKIKNEAVIKEFSSGVEEEEINEERGQEPTCWSGECDNRVKLRERDRVSDAAIEVCSLSAELGENSNINVIPPTEELGFNSDLLDQQDNCQKNSTNSMTSSRRNSRKSEQNGKQYYAPQQNTATWDLSTGVEAEARQENGITEHKVKSAIQEGNQVHACTMPVPWHPALEELEESKPERTVGQQLE